jgi:hypothetical protein
VREREREKEVVALWSRERETGGAVFEKGE